MADLKVRETIGILGGEPLNRLMSRGNANACLFFKSTCQVLAMSLLPKPCQMRFQKDK